MISGLWEAAAIVGTYLCSICHPKIVIFKNAQPHEHNYLWNIWIKRVNYYIMDGNLIANIIGVLSEINQHIS